MLLSAANAELRDSAHIEGSTRLVQELGRAGYGEMLAPHHRIIRSAISGADGAEVKTEGDAFFAVLLAME
jgi:class 3 adenylate cyclase